MTSSRNLRAARPVFMGICSVSRIPSKWMDAAEVVEEGPVRGRGGGRGRVRLSRAGHLIHER